MRKILITMLMMASMYASGQDKLPAKPKSDLPCAEVLEDGVYIVKSGVRYSGKTYTEIYDVVTDSVVNRLGLEFRSSDSSFVRRVPMEGIDRELYDRMKSDTDSAVGNQERMRKETIEFINRYKASYGVWLHFKVLGIFGR